MIETVHSSAERAGCEFPLINIPFGVFISGEADARPTVGTRVGDYVVDLGRASALGLFDGTPMEEHRESFSRGTLNEFMRLGRSHWLLTRRLIQDLIRGFVGLRSTEGLFHEADSVRMLMPVEVGDYTDFYSSKEHATNVGVMFRGRENALNPNWTRMPIAYHGRASSVVVAGTPTHRPCGQLKAPADPNPSFGPTKKLDYELEMAFVVGKGNDSGKPISVEDTRDHIFGVVLLNDWSGKDNSFLPLN